MKKDRLIKKITEIALDVYDCLGSGHSEYVYENAIKVGLNLAKISYDDQRVVPLFYKDFYVGYGNPDIIIKNREGDIVVDIKAISKIGGKEEGQVRSYMRPLNLKNGLLINMQAPNYDSEKETAVEVREIFL